MRAKARTLTGATWMRLTQSCARTRACDSGGGSGGGGAQGLRVPGQGTVRGHRVVQKAEIKTAPVFAIHTSGHSRC